jgi:hypothetical protein
MMDTLVVGPARIDAGQVVVIDINQSGPNLYHGNDLGTIGSWTAIPGPDQMRLTTNTALGPVHFTAIAVQLDDPEWFAAQLESDTILTRSAAPSSFSTPPPNAGAGTLLLTEGAQSSSLSQAQRASFGSYYALVIGNDGYEDLPRLSTARNDAEAVSSLLRKRYGFEVTMLEDATRAQILTSFRNLRETLTPSDNLLIYYAGHGWLDKDADEGYWLPVDAEEDSDVNWISNATITSYLRSIQAKHVMIVADSCYSGTLTRGINIKVKPPGYLERLSRQRARIVMSSGGLEPVADGGGGGQHSAFARHFLDELNVNKEVLDSTTLYSRIRRPVMLAADQEPELADIRKAGHDGGDFLFIPTADR